jgi:hypothetical protein
MPDANATCDPSAFGKEEGMRGRKRKIEEDADLAERDQWKKRAAPIEIWSKDWWESQIRSKRIISSLPFLSRGAAVWVSRSENGAQCRLPHNQGGRGQKCKWE